MKVILEIAHKYVQIQTMQNAGVVFFDMCIDFTLS